MSIRHIVFAASVVLAASGAARADGPPGGWHGGMERGPHGYLGFMHGVTLTDAQRAQVVTILRAGATAKHALESQMRSIHEQIMGQLASTASVSKDQLNSLVRQEDRLRVQADEAHMAQVLAVRNLLTPDQLAQAATTHAKMAALHDQERALMQPASVTTP